MTMTMILRLFVPVNSGALLVWIPGQLLGLLIDPLEHSGLNRTDDVGSGLVPLEPLEHSVLVTSREESEVSVINITNITILDPMEHSGVEMRTEMISAYLPRVFSEDPSQEGGDTRNHRGVKTFHS